MSAGQAVGRTWAAQQARVTSPCVRPRDEAAVSSRVPPPWGHFLITREGLAGETLRRDVGASCLETRSNRCHRQPAGLPGTQGWMSFCRGEVPLGRSLGSGSPGSGPGTEVASVMETGPQGDRELADEEWACRPLVPTSPDPTDTGPQCHLARLSVWIPEESTWLCPQTCCWCNGEARTVHSGSPSFPGCGRSGRPPFPHPEPPLQWRL